MSAKPTYTKWRIFKSKSGRWWAKNRSLADGFVYEQRDFNSHADALSYVSRMLR